MIGPGEHRAVSGTGTFICSMNSFGAAAACQAHRHCLCPVCCRHKAVLSSVILVRARFGGSYSGRSRSHCV